MSEKQGFGFVLARLREDEKMSQQAIGDLIGVSRSAVNSYEKGKSYPVADKLLKLAQHFNVSVDYLLTGKDRVAAREKQVVETNSEESQKLSSYMEAAPGGLAAPGPPQRVQPSDNLRILTVQVAPDGDENIELVPVWAAAGYTAGGFTQPTFIEKLPSFRLPGAAFNNGSFRCFQVQGSSMQGTLQDGDWIICRFVEKWAHDILDNRVYVVVSETDILVKRVLNQINENGRLSLHSDNPTFDVQSMDWQEVREVWQGVARLTLDLTNTRLDLPAEFAKQQALLADVLRRLDKLEDNL